MMKKNEYPVKNEYFRHVGSNFNECISGPRNAEDGFRVHNNGGIRPTEAVNGSVHDGGSFKLDQSKQGSRGLRRRGSASSVLSLISCSSSQVSCAAAVEATIDPDRARRALRASLVSRGLSDEAIDRELACHMSTAEIRRAQRTRRQHSKAQRERAQQWKGRRKANGEHHQLQQQQQRNKQTGIESGYQSNIQSNARTRKPKGVRFELPAVNANLAAQGSLLRRNDTNRSRRNSKSGSFHSQTTSSKSQYNNNFKPLPLPRRNRSNQNRRGEREAKVSPLSAAASLGNHQQQITTLFAALQKARDRGRITEAVFEQKKNELMEKLVFENRPDGRVTLKRTSLAAIQASQDQFLRDVVKPQWRGGVKASWRRGGRPRQSNSGPAARFPIPCNNRMTNIGAENEKDRYFNPAEKGLLSLPPFPTTAVRVEPGLLGPYPGYIPAPYDCHISETLEKRLHSPEFDTFNDSAVEFSDDDLQKLTDNECAPEMRKWQAAERRSMLMRRLDQRAPPEYRVFSQNTSLRRDGFGPTAYEENDWRSWRRRAKVAASISHKGGRELDIVRVISLVL